MKTIRYERRKVRLDSEFARHALAAHGRCPRCGMGAHRPDNVCDGKEKK